MVIKVYISGMSGNKEVKKRQQRVTMIMESKHIEYTVIDITEPGQEGEKDFMQTNAQHKGCTISDPSPRHALPPQLFNDTEYCGDYDDFDMANEVDNLEVFLKLAAPAPAAPEVEHKNGAPGTDETTGATGAADDDENKENKTEDNTDGGATEAAADDAGANETRDANDETNEVKEAPPEGASVSGGGEIDKGKGEQEAPAENTSTVADEEVEEENGKQEAPVLDRSTAADDPADAENDELEPLSSSRNEGESKTEERLLEEHHGANDKATNEQDVSEESEQPVESRELLGLTEAAPEAVEDTIHTHEETMHAEGDEDQEKSPTPSNNAVVRNESPEFRETDNDSLSNDEGNAREGTLPENMDQVEQGRPDAVGMELDTEAAVKSDRPDADEIETSVEDDSETSSDEQDSQKANNVSRLGNEMDENEHETPAHENRESLLEKDSTEVTPVSASEDDSANNDSEKTISPSSEVSDRGTLLDEKEDNVTPNQDALETGQSLSPAEEDDGEEDADDAHTDAVSVAEELLPVGTERANGNSNIPPPSVIVEETTNAVEMDADPDEEERELLKTSAALAGKSEDAEEIDIEEEATEEDEPAQVNPDDAGEDGISSKLVDTDDPMLVEQEQEE